MDEIAAQAGYASAAAFSRAFTRIYGRSPARWRGAQAPEGAGLDT
jgi:transcriptional regulator GlxA family with amidase domain